MKSGRRHIQVWADQVALPVDARDVEPALFPLVPVLERERRHLSSGASNLVDVVTHQRVVPCPSSRDDQRIDVDKCFADFLDGFEAKPSAYEEQLR